MPATVWVICGAGSGVGKTHLAQQLCAVLPNAVYAKQGHGERRPDGPENFYQTDTELDTFIAGAADTRDHIVIESNERARRGTDGVVIFIDGVEGLTDLRPDREKLRRAANIEISAAAPINSWKRVLRDHLTDSALGEVICDCLMRQKRHLFGGRPQARVKLWIEEGGMHVFGAGLSRLLEQIDRHGTLRGAARAARMSYRHAWGLLKNAEKHHGQALVIQQPGGVGGGRSTLSEHGRYMLRSYREMQDRMRGLADAWFSEVVRRAKAGGSVQDVRSNPVEPEDRRGTSDSPGVRRVTATQISATGAAPLRRPCDVAVEMPVPVRVADVGEYTFTCTPVDLDALVVGWALHSGLISRVTEIADYRVTTDPPSVEMHLTDACREAARGAASQQGPPACGDTLRVPGSLLLKVAREMWATQAIFQQTGGAHAVGVYQTDGRILALGQDIGRHHAFDKAIGKCLLTGHQTAGRAVMLSGRCSQELVSKAARAGIELISAVSAPSSLAIEAAERANITLCGFVRDTRATVFTHPRRVIDAESAS